LGAPREGQGADVRLGADDLSRDQRLAYDALRRWAADPDDLLVSLGGYAGTGKSTLIGLLAREALATRQVAFCAFTGKAGNVLRQKLTAAGVNVAGHHCGTIHSLIYEPRICPRTGRLLGFSRVPRISAGLVVVDEASMIGRKIWDDLRSYGVKVMAVGDHGQLPPVASARINLMTRPDLRLERIHRQAQDNPILALAEQVRGGASPGALSSPDESRARVRSGLDLSRVRALYERGGDMLDRAALCYMNRTRNRLNDEARRALGFRGRLQAGEVVICLRNTTLGQHRLFNGMRGIVEEATPDGAHYMRATIRFPDDDLRLVDGRLVAGQFGRRHTFADFDALSEAAGQRIRSWPQAGLLFDYGYALTVHKSQGSQFDQVLMVAEPGLPSDGPDKRARWLYTGVTRAAVRLEVQVP